MQISDATGRNFARLWIAFLTSDSRPAQTIADKYETYHFWSRFGIRRERPHLSLPLQQASSSAKHILGGCFLGSLAGRNGSGLAVSEGKPHKDWRAGWPR